MDLWIRNQDRKVLKLIRTVTVKDKKVIGYTMTAGFGTTDEITLGTYETEARAMVVLDSVQGKIGSGTNATAVFEMPKE